MHTLAQQCNHERTDNDAQIPFLTFADIYCARIARIAAATIGTVSS